MTYCNLLKLAIYSGTDLRIILERTLGYYFSDRLLKAYYLNTLIEKPLITFLCADRIQRELDVSFGEINGVTGADLNTLDKIIYLLDGGKLPQTGKVATIQLEVVDEEPILRALEKEVFDFTYGPIPGHHTLLGTDIALDYGLNSNDGVVVNKQEVISRLKQGLNKFTLTSESKNGTYFIGYWKIFTSNQNGNLILTNLKNKPESNTINGN